MASTTPGAEESRRGRKRLRYQVEWKRKKRKLQKDKGETYTTYKGERRAAKQLVSLTCHCAYHCRERVTEVERERIFKAFYQLGSNDAQNKYLYGLIRKKIVKRRTRGAARPRSHTLSYHVRLRDGSHVQVCKHAFCDLHAIGKRRVENLVAKLTAGVLVATDQRGKHKNRPHATSEATKQKIREHIKTFPRRKSHYSRSDNRKREYLDENLSISRMYLLYLEKHEPQVKETGAKPEVKEWLYRKIFNEEFNLSFGYPRSDTCETCDLLHVTIQASKSEAERVELQLELAAHQEKASQGYRLLRSDTEATKSAGDHTLLTFDLMQNLPVPTLTHGSMFYSRQLSVYNFGIHNTTTGTASMYMWNEAIASRGADEICSCLTHHLTVLSPQTKKLTCYSDSCFGQNKNFQMVCFWNQQVLERFEQVDHKFLVRGHTYLPNDRDFAHIEKRKESARVYVPKDWELVVREARPLSPFTVVPMESSKFLDFAELSKQYTHRKKDADKKPVLISKAVWMNFGQGEDISGELKKHPNEVWLRYSYNTDEPWSKVSLLKGRKKLPPSRVVPLPEKYPNGHAVKSKKLEDLERMIPFLPPESRQFYNDLLTSVPRDTSNDSDDD